jgi:hypothetical protein
LLNEILASIWESDGNALQSDWFEARDHFAELADEEKQILERLQVQRRNGVHGSPGNAGLRNSSARMLPPYLYPFDKR